MSKLSLLPTTSLILVFQILLSILPIPTQSLGIPGLEIGLERRRVRSGGSNSSCSDEESVLILIHDTSLTFYRFTHAVATQSHVQSPTKPQSLLELLLVQVSLLYLLIANFYSLTFYTTAYVNVLWILTRRFSFFSSIFSQSAE
jgi:hypothetical protein